MNELPRIFFLIPIYNESPNIELLAKNLKAVLPGYQRVYIFADDASTDDTVQALYANFSGEELRVLETRQNGGPGSAFNRGFQHILTEESPEESDLVVTLEADNTSDLSILPDMLSINQLGYELVLASIYAQGGGLDRTSLFRKVLSYGANFLFRFLFDVSVLTLSSFYRVYSVSLLSRVQAKYPVLVKEAGFICALELLLKCLDCGARVIEVPMTLKSYMRKGASKMKVARTTLAYLKFLARWKKRG